MYLSYLSFPLQTKGILTEWKEDRIDGHVVDAEEGRSNNIRPNNDNLAKNIDTISVDALETSQ